MVAGNVVEDRQASGEWAPGGPSLYAARCAAALGARVTLVTRLEGGYDTTALAAVDVIGLPAERTPRYANTYGDHGDRTQLLLDEGEPLDELPVVKGSIDAVILAPAFHEFGEGATAAWECYRAPVRSISLQGILRTVRADRRVVSVSDPLAAVAGMAPEGTHAFFSDEDTADPQALARALSAAGCTAIVTRGHRGATVYRGSAVEHFPALPANPVDPTGAGDCFAAAFTVRLAETGSTAEAITWALAAGAIAVEGAGLAGIPRREAIERRIARDAA